MNNISNPANACQTVFCFFCGKKLGPFASEEGKQELAKKYNFKRRKHWAYSGKRWICKPCRVKERDAIREAETREK